MDNKDQNDIPEYVKALPKAVQDFVYDGEWEKRTLEIATKYSLNEIQANTLADKVLFVLIGLETPGIFLETLTDELGVSQIISEQIISDIEKRVFEYALKETEPKLKPEITQTNAVQPTTEIKNQLPEIKPEMTPMVEEGEIVHSNPVETISVPKYVPEAEKLQQTPVQPAPPQAPVNIQRKPVEEPPKKYVVDPYREPLE
jgi:hypothetical protein